MPTIETPTIASADTRAAVRDLRREISGTVYDDPVHRGLYATDASHYQMMPACVVVPRDEADVLATVGIALRYGLPITGRGGGTSLAGQTFGPGLVIDFSKHLDDILEIDLESRLARIRPGIVRDRFNAAIAPHRLHFAPDPATSSRATIGGMIANNSSGMRSIIHGMTVDHITAIKLLLSDGTVCELEPCDRETWRRRAAGEDRTAELYRGVGQLIGEHHQEIAQRFPKVVRKVAGYNLDRFPIGEPPESLPPASGTWNLAELICGSEGTLGIILEATIRLTPLPEATSLCVIHFHDLIDALRPLPWMLEHQPSAVELLDETIITEALTNPSTRGYIDVLSGHPEALQIVEFSGESEQEVIERAHRFCSDMRQRGVGDRHIIRTEPDAIGKVWELRRLGVGLQSNLPGRRKPLDFIDDACVPVDSLAEYTAQLRDLCDEFGVRMPICGHASVGVLHPKPMLDLHDPDDQRKMKQIADRAFELARRYGGSWCGEHGDGLVRGAYLEPYFGPKIYEAFRTVKRLFDPGNLMNPGKILDTPGMIEFLRHHPTAPAPGSTPGSTAGNTPGSLGDYPGQSDAARSTESDRPPTPEPSSGGYRIAEIASLYRDHGHGGFAANVEQCNGVGACRKLDKGTMCPSYMATRDEEASTRGRANALRLAMTGQLERDDLTSGSIREVLSLCLSCKACKSECPNGVDMARLKAEVAQMRYDRRGVPIAARLIGKAPELARRFSGLPAAMVNRVQRGRLFRWLVAKLTGLDARRPLPEYAGRTLTSLLRRRAWRSASMDGPEPRVALFADTYLNHHHPELGSRAIELLEACGYRVILLQAGCCQRPRLSKGLLREARRLGAATISAMLPIARRGVPILFLEPSCHSAITDDLPGLLEQPEEAGLVADHSLLIDEFLARERAEGRLNVAFKANVTEIAVHGHCHRKALRGMGAMGELLRSIPGLTVTELDAGCCGMAGSFGWERYDVSLAIGRQRLFPAARAAEKRHAALCADGISCRQQLEHGCGVSAQHFVELIDVEPARDAGAP
ncbi:MAG: FAD-binding protein [Phycisphaeraceae bacterium]|nr:FAD-binding protein [Phycisphaeraceae bacterium]